MHKHIPPAFFEDIMVKTIVQNKYKDAAGSFRKDAEFVVGAPTEFDYKIRNEFEAETLQQGASPDAQAIMEQEASNVGIWPMLRVDKTLEPARRFKKGLTPRIRHRDPFGPETTSPPYYDHDWDPRPNVVINPVPDFEKHYDDYNIHPSQNPDTGAEGFETLGRRFSLPRPPGFRDPAYETAHRERLTGLGRGLNPSDRGTTELPVTPYMTMVGAPDIRLKSPDDYPIDRKGRRLPDF